MKNLKPLCLIFFLSIFIEQNLVIATDVSASEIEEITTGLEKTKLTRPVTLARVSNNKWLVKHTQELTTEMVKLSLNRESTRGHIEYVSKASKGDGSKTHLVAQGFCINASLVLSERFLSTGLEFPGVSPDKKMQMSWVSKGSNAESTDTHYMHKSIYFGGHAEPQLISDLEAVFKTKPDAVVDLFMPPAEAKETVSLCGLELFGPYDMCDRYNDEGCNKYNCVGLLRAFRTRHQEGQDSISTAIREKLKDRFKGKNEDAFVVIYHAQSPYDNVNSYCAVDSHYNLPYSYYYPLCYPLQFDFDDRQFSSSWPFDGTYELSQHKSLPVEPGVLYGNIHLLADKTITYRQHLKGFPVHNNS